MAKMRADSNPSGSSSKKKKKKATSKKLLSGPNTMAMKSQSTVRDNPFETIWSRKKFDILGKKRKGEVRLNSLRSKAIDKRKNTLLKEYQRSSKSSVFVDRRIGEHNETLGEFDKNILRSQRVRQLKVSKKSKYNLSDGEEDDTSIYGGEGFSERDDFDDELPPEDDEDDSENKLSLSDKADNPSKYGPGHEEESKHKSKKEVMEEIMLKSKLFKALKAKEKEENVELMEQLDKDFTSLVQSDVLRSLTQPGKMAALKALVNKSSSKELAKKDDTVAPARIGSPKQEQPDAYDKLVKEMALDMRARPSDRTKTAEEIAQDERERLERLEEEHRERMLAVDDSSDEGDDAVDGSAKNLRSISGDDLGDSFSFEEPSKKKGWVDEIYEREGNSAENEEDDASSGDQESDEDGTDDEEGSSEDGELRNTTSLKDWEQSDDENLSASLEDEDDEDEDEEGDDDDDDDDDNKEEQKDGRIEGKAMLKEKDTIPHRKNNNKADTSSIGKTKADKKKSESQLNALPFIIEVPNNLEGLCSLVESRSDSEVIEAINRIRASNAIRLAAENRKKMQVFYGILLQYFAVIANKRPLKFKLLNLFIKPLMEMSMETPYFASICARERILRTRTQLCEDIKNPEKSCWPSMKTLMLLRLWSMIFPCSDFRHVVMTPAALLMCEYLMRCPIRSGRDIAVGSFLCSMVLCLTKQSKKFYPEAIIFLRTLLMSTLETQSSLFQHSEFYYLSEVNMLKPWLRLHHRVSEIDTLDFVTVMNTPDDSSFFSSDSFRTSVLMSVVETLRGFVNIYGGYNSFPEIFLPISALLHEVAKQENIPGPLQDSIKDIADVITRKADEHHTMRQPLQMRKQKPVPIKQLTPKFEENFVKGRDYDPDRERADRKKLRKQLKEERKGAIRELRKDNHFLYQAKQKDRAENEKEKAEKYGKARAFLQEQEHAFKSGQLGKGRKRRR